MHAITAHGYYRMSSACILAFAVAYTPYLSAQSVLEEVIVTAQKREQNLMDVPVTINVVAGDDIDRGFIKDLAELSQVVPGYNLISDAPSRAFSSMRGIGALPGDEVAQAVGIFIDGVYLPDNRSVNLPLVDVEQIEVLKGPQGTLYGKNTMAGAINIRTRAPSMDDLEARFNASAGNDNTYRVQASVSAPIVDDKLAFRLAGNFDVSDGFWSNKLDGNDEVLKREVASGRLSVLAAPSEDLSIMFRAYIIDVPHTSLFATNIVNGPNDDPGANLLIGVDPIATMESWGASADITYTLPNEMQIVSISAYHEVDNRSFFSPLPGPVPNPFGFAATQDRTGGRDTFIQELRLHSAPDDKLQWLVGVFYSDEDRFTHGTASLFIPAIFLPPLPPPFPQFPPGTILNSGNTGAITDDHETVAVFGNVNYRFNEKWEIGLGLRYDDEDIKHNVADTAFGFPLPAPFTTTGSDSAGYSEWQPKGSLSYHFDDGKMAYFSVSKGFRSGGFNGLNVLPQFGTFDAEETLSFELGGKFELFGGNTLLNAAVFFIEYDNVLQRNSGRGQNNVLTEWVENLGSGESLGFEFDGKTRVMDGLTLNYSFFYADAEITESSLATWDPTLSEQIFYAPEYSGRVGFDFNRPVSGNLKFLLSANISFTGDTAWSQTQVRDPYEIVDVLGGFQWNKWGLFFYGNNITDVTKHNFFTPGYNLPIPPGTSLANYIDEVSYGVRLEWEY